jgi:uncharacterized membrane protein (UPF0182 family)
VTFPRPFPRPHPGGRGPRAPIGRRGRVIAGTVVGLVIIITLLVVIGNLYTDLLWFRSVDYSHVFTTQLWTKVLLFFVFGIVMALIVGINIVVAFRLRPTFRPQSPEQESLERIRAVSEPFQRWVLAVVLVLIGIAAGSSAAGKWRTWLLWRHGQHFGIKDQQFHKDISYFTFTYPFQRWILGFAFTAVVLSVIAAAVTYYLFGGLRVQTPGEKVTPAARAHLSLLLGLFVLLKAVAYFLDRYGLAFSLRGVVQGPSYTDVHAVLPAKTILVVVAIICAGLFFANIAYRRWVLPIVAFGVMVLAAIVIGGVYPAIVQHFSVAPNAADKEAPYISRNIAATRAAYGLPDPDSPDVKQNYAATTTATAGKLARDAASLPGIRLLDPNVVSATYNQLQQIRGFYSFPDVLDIDRYTLASRETDSVVAVRDINLNGLAGDQNNWINRHLVYTHGFGFVGAPTSPVDEDGKPVFFEKNIPPVGPLGQFEPRIYFGETSPSYSIVGNKPGVNNELDRPTDVGAGSVTGQVNTTYAGKGGVPMGSFMRRVLYAVKFKEKNILLSSRVNSESKILYVRDPRARVAKVAPYLRFDGDPYPAVVDGRILWIVDGYTTTNSFPYSQRTSLGTATEDTNTENSQSVKRQEANKVNYIRNSVKATVDAYDGTVTLYEWDQQQQPDAILKTWEKIFPHTIKPQGDMSPQLVAHVRYPEDLFKVQRQLLTKYHVTDPKAFYSGADFWTVPNDPTTTQQVPQPPYYLTLQVPGQTAPTFQLTSTLNPRKRNNMAAYVSVESDPGANYGKFTILQLPRDTQINGVEQVGNNFESFPDASKELSLFRQGGSDVTLGNLLALPVADGFLFVEPVYVKARGGTSYPLLKRVFASFGESIAYQPTLQQALDAVFKGSSGVTVGNNPPPSATPTTTQTSAALQAAIAQLNAAQAAADKALKAGDLAAYAAAEKDVAAAIRAVNAALKASTTTPSPSPSSASPSPGPSP